MNTNINPDIPENYSQQPHNGTPQPQTHNGTAQTQPQTRPGLIMRTASERLNSAKEKPPFSPLFDVFWGKGELALLFGDTGIGKSILAVQIADAISKGAKVLNFDGPQTPMKVGYFDFELSDTQLLKRYSDERGNVYQFSDNFWRFEMNPDLSIPKGMNYQDLILQEIEQAIIEDGLEVVVIDSFTSMPSYTEIIGKLELMHKLYLLRSRQNISMLVIGHSLRHDFSRPVTEYDIVGTIFCDSVFAIGESMKEKNVRYLKQIKCSSAEFKYDSENVAVLRLVKHDRFIGFEHIGFDDESEHLCESSYW